MATLAYQLNTTGPPKLFIVAFNIALYGHSITLYGHVKDELLGHTMQLFAGDTLYGHGNTLYGHVKDMSYWVMLTMQLFPG